MSALRLVKEHTVYRSMANLRSGPGKRRKTRGSPAGNTGVCVRERLRRSEHRHLFPVRPKHRVVSKPVAKTRGSVMCPDRSTGPAVATWSVKSCGTPDCRRLGRGVGTAHRPLICHRLRRRSAPKSERAGVAFRFCAANLHIHITTSAPCTVSLQAFRGGCQATRLWYLRVLCGNQHTVTTFSVQTVVKSDC